MADQGLPLMALPQQNLFGAAGDDLAGVLANRELAKRKQMLEDIKTQIEMQKSQNETGLAQNTIDTGASERRLKEAAAPGVNARTAAETEGMNLGNNEKKQAAADYVKRGEALDRMTAVMQNPNATQQDQVAAFSDVVRYGGKLDPEFVKSVGAMNEHQAVGVLMDKYNEALNSKDPNAIKMAGLAYMNAGGKGMAPITSEKFAQLGNGGLFRPDTGEVTREPMAPAGQNPDALTSKNYQVVKNNVDKLRAQYITNLPRMERLEATLAENSPQADALVAPELLTVMAGGQGSGLRMNEAEIARIVGGRNKWQDLQSAINHWQADPTKPFLITPEQRQQIGHLIGAVKGNVKSRLDEIQKADDALLAAGSVDEQRQIFVNLQKSLEGIGGHAGNEPPPGSKVVPYDMVNGRLVPRGGG